MKKNNKIKIAIIGYGKFGSLIADILHDHFESIYVFTRSETKGKAGLKFFTDLENVSDCDIVIPTVPIPAFESTVKKLNPFLKTNSIFVDVCSVKKYPVEIMTKHLRKDIKILATHPMWGPESVKLNKGIKDLKIVLHPVRIKDDEYLTIKKFLQKIGFIIFEMTPDQHDKEAAESQILAQFTGKIAELLPAKKVSISTKGYDQLYSLTLFLSSNTEELFYSLQKYNPYAKEIRDKYIKIAQKINDDINNYEK